MTSRQTAIGNWSVFTVLGLVTLSGAAGLTHELLWTRRLVDLLGAGPLATSRVFACFFLGLSLGAALVSRIVDRVKNPWRVAAIAEGMVALFTLPIFFLSRWGDVVWPWLGPENLVGWQGSSIKLVLCFVTVVPPATAMGTVLPLILAVMPLARVAKISTRLYGANTLGGALALPLCSCLLVPALGSSGSLAVAMTGNLMCALVCFVISLRPLGSLDTNSSRTKKSPQKNQPTHDPQISLMALLFWAFWSGAGVIGLEILAIHSLGLVAVSSLPSHSALLAPILLLLALAAVCCPLIIRLIPRPENLLRWSLIAGGLVVMATPFLFQQATDGLRFLGTAPTLFHYFVNAAGLVFRSMALAFFLAGLVFPTLLYLVGNRSREKSASTISLLFAANGVGAVVGGDVTQFVLLPTVGLSASYMVWGILYAWSGCLWAVKKPFRTEHRGAGYALAIGLVIYSAITWWFRPDDFNARYGFKPLEVRAGWEGVVAAAQHEKFGRGILMNNQYLLGSTAALGDEQRQGSLPLLLHQDPQEVCFIGLATGITAGSALLDPRVKRVTSVEIAPTVVELAEKHFPAENNGLLAHPKSRIVVEDGRAYMLACQGAFDLVVADLYMPWNLGEGRLYSREHFLAIRSALKKGGLFCQWLPMHQLEPPQFEVILRTMQEAFPNVHLWRGNLKPENAILGLIAFKDGRLDWDIAFENCAAARKFDKVKDPALRHPEGLALLYLGSMTDIREEVRINTLENNWLEIDAGSHRITGNLRDKYLRDTRWLAFVEKLFVDNRSQKDSLPDDFQHWPELAREIERGRIAQQSGQNVRDTLKNVAEQLSPAMKQDLGADWQLWPAN